MILSFHDGVRDGAVPDLDHLETRVGVGDDEFAADGEGGEA